MTRQRVLPYGKQDISDADIQAVVDCLRGDWLTQGPRVGEFEARLREATGAPHAVAVANGTAALHLACLALGVGPGDIGVTSPITFAASANALLYVGAEPRFADVEPDTALIDVDQLEKVCEELAAAGRPPRVLIPVDLAGQPADLPRIRALADRFGAAVLEDAAHSLGATYTHEGKHYRAGQCAHTDAAILSFHPVKHVTTGEGGAVLTSDEGLANRVRDRRTHGIHKDAARLTRSVEDDVWAGPWYYEMDQLGYNYRLSDLQCALGLSQLTRLDVFVARRRAIASIYDEALSRPPLAGRIAPLRQRPAAQNAYHLYVAQVVPRPGEPREQTAARRKQLFLFLRERDVLCQVHYIPVTWLPYYGALGHRPEDHSGAADYYARSLSLPMFPALRDDDVERVIEALGAWVERDCPGP